MATHSSVLAWRIPGTGEPGGLLSMGSHRVEHDWSDLAAAVLKYKYLFFKKCTSDVFFLCLYQIYDHIFFFLSLFLQKHFMSLSWSKSSSGFPLHLKSSFSFLTRLTSCFACSLSAYSPVSSSVRLASAQCARAALV